MQNNQQTHIQNKDAYIDIRKKDYYQKLYDFFKNNNIKKVIDVGAATGDFSFIGPENIEYLSTDISEELTNIAEKTRSKSNIKFVVDDILNTKIKDKFDAVLMLGALNTFNNLSKLLNSLCNLSEKYVILHAPVNKYDFDSLIAHKNSNQGDDAYQNSFNIFSISSIKREFIKNKFKIISIENTVMKTLLEKVDKPKKVTIFHVEINKKKSLINHLGLVLDEKIIIAERIN